MKVSFTFRNVRSSEDLKGAALKKVQRLSKHFKGQPEIRMVLDKDGSRYTVEASVKKDQFSAFATYSSEDILTAIDEVVEIIDRQLHKDMERVRKRKRKGKRLEIENFSPDAHSEDYLEYKTVYPEVLSEQDAKLLLDDMEGAIVFIEQETQKLSILHRKRNGKIELIKVEF